MGKKYCLYALFVVIAFVVIGSNCDHGLKPRFTAVEGDLIIKGEWPEGTEMCFVVVTYEKPEELVIDIQLVQGFYQVPNTVFEEEMDSTHFRIEMPAGEYGWVFFAILDSAALDTENSTMGWRNLAAEYRAPADSSQLGTITIGEDELPYVKMEVDFTTPYRGVGNDEPLDYFHLEG